MAGTSPSDMLIGLTGTGAGMQWWNPQTGQWQTERPPLPTTCAANPPPNYFFGHNTVVGTPYQYPLTAEPVNGITTFCGSCGGRDEEHQAWCFMPREWSLLETLRRGTEIAMGHTVVKIPPLSEWPTQVAHPLSDADVERVARRVVELQNQLLAGVRALHDMVDQADPQCPIGVALTQAGLERKP